MKTIDRKCIRVIICLCLFLIGFSPPQMRDSLGDEKATAVEVVLKSVFPGTAPVWGAYLSVRDGTGTLTRIALTDLARIPVGAGSEFVFGLQEFEAADKNLELLNEGKPPIERGSHAVLTTVVRSTAGIFGPVNSSVLEPNHAFSTITVLHVDSVGAPNVVMIYGTTDLEQNESVEITWYALVDASLTMVKKFPMGVVVKEAGQSAPSRLLQISRTPTGIVIQDHAAQKRNELSCSTICEPTIQQLLNN